MKIEPSPAGAGFNGQILCGFWMTCVGPYGPYMKKYFCGGWACPDCRPRMIDKYLDAIALSFLTKVQVFVGVHEETGPALTNILRRVESYVCIRNHDGAVIISMRNFSGAKRKDKRKFLSGELQNILNKPWTKGPRVTHSKDLDLLPNSTRDKDILYASVLGNKLAEFEKLKGEKEKAYWLADQEYRFLYKAGRELIEKHVKKIPADGRILDDVAYRPEAIKELQHAEKQ